MDINQVFETLDDLDNKKSKINSAREQFKRKKKKPFRQSNSFI